MGRQFSAATSAAVVAELDADRSRCGALSKTLPEALTGTITFTR